MQIHAVSVGLLEGNCAKVLLYLVCFFEGKERKNLKFVFKNTFMAGKIVETKLGRGQTKNGDKPVNGKIIVYLDNGKKILCDPKNIKPIGFWD